jgi:hypothetical protein
MWNENIVFVLYIYSELLSNFQNCALTLVGWAKITHIQNCALTLVKTNVLYNKGDAVYGINLSGHNCKSSEHNNTA